MRASAAIRTVAMPSLRQCTNNPVLVAGVGPSSKRLLGSDVTVRTLSISAGLPSGNEDNKNKEALQREVTIGMPWSRKLSTGSKDSNTIPMQRKYYWIDQEAEKLIAIAYKLHLPDRPFPPSVGFDRKKLEDLKELPHFVPKDFSDKFALWTVGVLEKIMHLFFRSKYDHHAVTLETVAAVPGFLAAVHRHMRSLRRMKRDHGWIDNLLEEATNERMHLLIWMQITQPNAIERLFVLAAQGAYITAYSFLYMFSPKTAHRTVGYLEESAFRAYTDYLHAVDTGAIPNRVLASNSIAKKFYRLPDDATLRDVILHVRADEAFHALYNHGLSTQIREGGLDDDIVAPSDGQAQGGIHQRERSFVIKQREAISGHKPE